MTGRFPLTELLLERISHDNVWEQCPSFQCESRLRASAAGKSGKRSKSSSSRAEHLFGKRVEQTIRKKVVSPSFAPLTCPESGPKWDEIIVLLGKDGKVYGRLTTMEGAGVMEFYDGKGNVIWSTPPRNNGYTPVQSN